MALVFAERKHPSSLSNHVPVGKRPTSTEKLLSSLGTEAAHQAIGAHRTSQPTSSSSGSPAFGSSTTTSPALSYSLGKFRR